MQQMEHIKIQMKHSAAPFPGNVCFRHMQRIKGKNNQVMFWRDGGKKGREKGIKGERVKQGGLQRWVVKAVTQKHTVWCSPAVCDVSVAYWLTANNELDGGRDTTG